MMFQRKLILARSLTVIMMTMRINLRMNLTTVLVKTTL